MPRPASAIVIGGGVAGASIARWLSSRGVGVTVLEKAGQLCAGATWHAAGLVTRFGGSPKIKKVHVRALELMTALHDESDGCGLHLTGSIQLIEKGDNDRLLEAKRRGDGAAVRRSGAADDDDRRRRDAHLPLVDVSNVSAACSRRATATSTRRCSPQPYRAWRRARRGPANAEVRGTPNRYGERCTAAEHDADVARRVTSRDVGLM